VTGGLVARIREINPKITWQHCIIHKQNLVAKKMTPDLHDTLNTSVKVVALSKAHALNSFQENV
jgi:transposase-like protein